MNLHVLLLDLSICRLAPQAKIPDWALASTHFFNICRTSDELSIVAETQYCPEGLTCEADWKALKVEGILDFSLTGILAALTAPLAQENISLFAVSTYNTDYLLVKKENLLRAKEILIKAGHHFV